MLSFLVACVEHTDVSCFGQFVLILVLGWHQADMPIRVPIKHHFTLFESSQWLSKVDSGLLNGLDPELLDFDSA